MALTGVFVTWGFANVSLQGQQGQATLLGQAAASELMAAAGISNTKAPKNANANQQPVCSFMAAAPIYYVIGPNADASIATQPRRYFDPALGDRDVVVNGDDRFSWIAA